MMPVGTCVMRIADSVLLTYWPPAPDALYVSTCRSDDLISTSTSSSTCGSTATVAVLVWMRPCASVAGTRCTRCTPDSCLKNRYGSLALERQKRSPCNRRRRSRFRRRARPSCRRPRRSACTCAPDRRRRSPPRRRRCRRELRRTRRANRSDRAASSAASSSASSSAARSRSRSFSSSASARSSPSVSRASASFALDLGARLRRAGDRFAPGASSCGALLHERGVARLIECARRVGELRLDLVEAPRHRIEARAQSIVQMPRAPQLSSAAAFFASRAALRVGGLFLLLSRRGGALVELIDASGRIDELLLAGKERVACRADFDGDLRQRRAGNERIAARAVHAGLREPLGMDLLFHNHSIITNRTRGSACSPAVGQPVAWEGASPVAQKARPVKVKWPWAGVAGGSLAIGFLPSERSARSAVGRRDASAPAAAPRDARDAEPERDALSDRVASQTSPSARAG